MTRNRDNLKAHLEAGLDKIANGEDLETILAPCPDQAEDLRDALEAARWVYQRRLALDPRPGFVTASQHRLVTHLQSPGPHSRQRRLVWASRRLFSIPASPSRLAFQSALIVVMLCLALLSGRNVALALPTWLPGDWGYPVKTATEEASLALTLSAAGDAHLHIDFAQRRLLEVQSLVLEDRDAQITQSVANFTHHVQSAVNTVNLLASRDPQQAQALALHLQQVLQGQSGLISLMVGIAPQPASADLVQALVISSESLSAVKDLLSPEGTSGKTLGVLPSQPSASQAAILPQRYGYLRPNIRSVVTT
jgi:hypothetical protein